jgi:hypothetical protein
VFGEPDVDGEVSGVRRVATTLVWLFSQKMGLSCSMAFCWCAVAVQSMAEGGNHVARLCLSGENVVTGEVAVGGYSVLED